MVEACGRPLTFLQALQSAGRFGQVVFMGNISGQFVIGEQDFSRLLRQELRIFGAWNSRIVPRGKNDWSTVLHFLDRELEVEPLISHRLPLEQGPEIFHKMVQKEEYYSKVLFTFEGGDLSP